MAIEAVLEEVLKMPPDVRVELVERLIDSLDDEAVELSPEELAQLDGAIEGADVENRDRIAERYRRTRSTHRSHAHLTPSGFDA